MKNYIGVKVLQARCMTRGEYNLYRCWTMPEDENPEDAGYLTVHNDGLEQWLPKEAFESTYFEMGNNPSKITPDMVERFLGEAHTSGTLDEKTTMVVADTITGFRQYETSSFVDPENYDEKIGTEICLNKIKDTMWFCLGFVLQWGKKGLRVREDKD